MSLSRAERFTLAACTLLAMGTYAASVRFPFVYDDVQIIRDNATLHSLAGWREILTQTRGGHYLYRAITELDFAVAWALGGGRPALFHAVNVLLHGAVTALVYLVARGGLGPVGAGAAALVFAVHPVHVEAVAGAVGAAELLAALFTLVAALAYRTDGRLAATAPGDRRRGLTSFGTLAAVGLALASKESAFAAPGVLLLMDWWEGRRTGETLTEPFRRHALLWLATVALSLEWLWLRAGIVGGLAGDHPAPGLEGLGLVGRALDGKEPRPFLRRRTLVVDALLDDAVHARPDLHLPRSLRLAHGIDRDRHLLRRDADHRDRHRGRRRGGAVRAAAQPAHPARGGSLPPLPRRRARGEGDTGECHFRRSHPDPGRIRHRQFQEETQPHGRKRSPAAHRHPGGGRQVGPLFPLRSRQRRHRRNPLRRRRIQHGASAFHFLE